MLRGVADTNVLVSALIGSKRGPSAQLWLAARFGRWRVVVSPHLLAELEAVLHRERFRPMVSVDEVDSYLADLRAIAEAVPDAPHPWPTATRDIKDDYLVAPAKLAGVDALISGDLHLKELVSLVPPVMRPADFLAVVQEGRLRE